MDRRLIIAAVVVVIIVVVAVVVLAMQNQPGGSTGTGPAGTVNIQDFKFSPDTMTVNKGTTVTWTNHDNVDHTATSQSGPTSFDSGNIKPGGTYSYTFNETGTYGYICTIHPYMKGNVTVT
jgi:amicyanin